MKLKNSLEMRKKGRFGVKRIVAGCMALLNGEEVEPFSPVNVDLVTPENVADFGY